MKILQLRRDCREAAAKLRGQFAAPSHADQVVSRDTTMIAPDGSTAAVFLAQCIDPDLRRLAYELWKAVDGLPGNRATAVGANSLPRSTGRDGIPSRRSGVARTVLDVLKRQGVRQGNLGYLAATPGRPCRKTRLSIKRPEMLDGNRALIERVDELYRQNLPQLYAIQRAEVEKAGPRWRLWNTAFTTIYVTKDFRTAYHVDSGNLRGVMTAIMPMGNFTGGELVFPRWRIAIDYRPGDLLLFDPQHLHGNLRFEGERLSAAFFCARRIADCGK